MEYALLIESYRAPRVKQRTLLNTDNLIYFFGLALLVLPFTKFSLYFGILTAVFYLFVFLFLSMLDTNFISLLTRKEEEVLESEIKIAIDFKNLGLNFSFQNKLFSFNFLFYVFFSNKKGKVLGLSPPMGP